MSRERYCKISITVKGKGPDYTVDFGSTLTPQHCGLQLSLSQDDYQRLAGLTEDIRSSNHLRSAAVREKIRSLGAELFRILVNDIREIKQAYDECLRTVQRQGQERTYYYRDLVFELDIQSANMACLPWELLYDTTSGRGQYLLTTPYNSIVRLVPRPPSPSEKQFVNPPLRVLVIISCPTRARVLVSDQQTGHSWHQEQEMPAIDTLAISDVLHEVEEELGRDSIQFDIKRKVNYELLVEALESQYDALYYIGHAYYDPHLNEYFLLLEDGTPIRRGWELKLHRLKELLQKTSIRLAVLSSCGSAQSNPEKLWAGAAQTLLQDTLIDAVVGMQFDAPIYTTAAFDFAFFRELAAWLPIDYCVSAGRQAIARTLEEGEGDYLRYADWAIPVLFRRGEPLLHHFAEVPGGVYAVGLQQDEFPHLQVECPTGCSRPAERKRFELFQISRWQITNYQYQKFLDDTKHHPPLRWTLDKNGKPVWPANEGPNHPVVCVSYSDAQAYCKWRGVRLPQADEWEVAARGKEGYLFPWGNECDPEICNVKESARGRTVSVFSYPQGASSFGVWDMIGNVYEWTSTGSNSEQVIMGGSWRHGFNNALPHLRALADSNKRYDCVGFRCVL